MSFLVDSIAAARDRRRRRSAEEKDGELVTLIPTRDLSTWIELGGSRSEPRRPVSTGIDAVVRPRAAVLSREHDRHRARRTVRRALARSGRDDDRSRLRGRAVGDPRRRSCSAPLGGAGTPANLLALGLLLWWVMAKIGSGLGVDRSRQPVRIALLFFLLPILVSLITFYLQPVHRAGVDRRLPGAHLHRGAVRHRPASPPTASRRSSGPTCSCAGSSTPSPRWPASASSSSSIGWRPASTLTLPGPHPAGAVRAAGPVVVRPGAVDHAAPDRAERAARARCCRSRCTTRWHSTAEATAARLDRGGAHRGGDPARALPHRRGRGGHRHGRARRWDWTWSQRGRALAIVAGRAGGPAGRWSPASSAACSRSSPSSPRTPAPPVRQERYEIAGQYFLAAPVDFGRGFNTLYPATKQVFDNAYLYVATEEGVVGLVGTLALLHHDRSSSPAGCGCGRPIRRPVGSARPSRAASPP